MNDDHLFRVILIVGSSVLLPIAAYHRLKSQATGEKLDRWQEGLFVLIVIRTRKEEALLLARFGDAYRGYMERTGRFLPHIGGGKVSSCRLCL